MLQYQPMTSPVTFLKEVRIELDKVVWPSRDKLINLTFLVVAISFGVGVFIGAIDFVFFKIMEILL